jgi:DNA-binding HxlR family transcriptional regulator
MREPPSGMKYFFSPFTCALQVISAIFRWSKSKPRWRSGCPVSLSLERFGDRWSLLISRDLMVRGYRTFGEFQQAGAGIATNILVAGLKTLEAHGILTSEQNPGDLPPHRKRHGPRPGASRNSDLATCHEDANASCRVISYLETNRAYILSEVRKRWHARDTTPILPTFDEKAFGRNSGRRKS